MVIPAIQSSVGSVQSEPTQISQPNKQVTVASEMSPGTGAMQGTVVGVGNGTERAQLLDDSAKASNTLFSRIRDAMASTISGAGTVLSTVHAAMEEINGLAYDDDEDSNDQFNMDANPTKIDDTRSGGHESRAVGAEVSVLNSDKANSETVHSADDDGVQEYFYPINDISGEEEFFDCNNDVDSDADRLENISDASQLAKAKDTTTEALALDTSEIAEGSLSDGTVGFRLIEQSDQVKDLPLVVVGEQEDRDVAEAEVQAPQQTWGKWFAGTAGWAAGGVVTLLLDALIKQAPDQATTQASRAPTERFSEQNLKRANVLANEIEKSMQKLNLQLRALGGDLPAVAIAPKEQINQPKLDTRDMLNRWYYKAQGGASAGISTLGWATVGTGTATLGVVFPGIDPASLGIRATAILGGAYMGLSALRDFPELATNRTAVAMLKGELPAISKDMLELDDILGQERARQTAKVRTMMVTDARNPRMAALMGELSNVSSVLEKIEKGEINAVPDLRHEVALGDGKASNGVRRVASQARETFASFFQSVGRGFAIVQRAITFLPNVVSRWLDSRAAAQAERAAVNEIESTLRVLATSVAGSHISDGNDVRAKERAQANGSTHSVNFVRGQCQMGENLTRTLLKQEGQAFGAVAYGDPEHPVSISATLTTARAMAWYLDAIASPEPNGRTDMPQVTRHDDGSLTVVDPDRKLYSFLMNVPVAYIATIAGTGQQSLALDIDDHHQNMPQGMSSMRFETRIDDSGQKTLHLSFNATKTYPVFKPLGAETHYMIKMYEAAHSAQLPKSAERADFSAWPKDRLMVHQDMLFSRMEREIAMVQDDQKQIEALEDWHNPAFFSGRV